MPPSRRLLLALPFSVAAMDQQDQAVPTTTARAGSPFGCCRRSPPPTAFQHTIRGLPTGGCRMSRTSRVGIADGGEDGRAGVTAGEAGRAVA